MQLIIAGSRALDVSLLDLRDLLDMLSIKRPSVILCGGCPTGVDAWAEREASAHGIPTVRYSADWDEHRRSAGPRRNQQMADNGAALLLIWDGRSRGSADMRRKMLAAGKPVYEMIIRKIP